MSGRTICYWPFLVEVDLAVAAGHFSGDISSAGEGVVFQQSLLLDVLESGFRASGPRLELQGAAASGSRRAESRSPSRIEVFRG